MTEEDEIEEQRASLARQASELATKAITIANNSGFTLDLTESSLDALDALLAHLSETLTDAQKENAAQLYAAYVLEVGHRAHGGHFQWWHEHDAPVLVVGGPDCHIGLFALDKIRGRLAGDPADNVRFFYDGFARRSREREPGDQATYIQGTAGRA